MPRMCRASLAPLAALALAASLIAGCDTKKSSPAPAAEPKPEPTAPATPTTPPKPPTLEPTQPTPTQPAQPTPTPTPPAQPPAQSPAPAKPAGPGMSAAEAIHKLTVLADRVCACADRACGDAAAAAAKDEDGQLAALPSSAETEAMKAQAKRLYDCQQKLK